MQLCVPIGSGSVISSGPEPSSATDQSPSVDLVDPARREPDPAAVRRPGKVARNGVDRFGRELRECRHLARSEIEQRNAGHEWLVGQSSGPDKGDGRSVRRERGLGVEEDGRGRLLAEGEIAGKTVVREIGEGSGGGIEAPEIAVATGQWAILR